MKSVRILAFLTVVSVVGSGFATAQIRRQTRLSDLDISRGLKEALSVGIKNAVNELGRENGFCRIPM